MVLTPDFSEGGLGQDAEGEGVARLLKEPFVVGGDGQILLLQLQLLQPWTDDGEIDVKEDEGVQVRRLDLPTPLQEGAEVRTDAHESRHPRGWDPIRRLQSLSDRRGGCQRSWGFWMATGSGSFARPRCHIVSGRYVGRHWRFGCL